MLNRVYVDSEDVSNAILNAGMELRPEDCSSLKFRQIADELTIKMHHQMRREIDKFTKVTLADLNR
jgi:hypothetical protein